MDPGIHVEIANAQAQVELEHQSRSSLRVLGAIKELFTTKDNLRRIALIFTLQCLGEWSGPNSVTSEPNGALSDYQLRIHADQA